MIFYLLSVNVTQRTAYKIHHSYTENSGKIVSINPPPPRRYTAKTLPTLRKTPDCQSINPNLQRSKSLYYLINEYIVAFPTKNVINATFSSTCIILSSTLSCDYL